MSQLDKVLSNVIDYKYLLSFLRNNYPQVLEEWKLKIIDYRIDYRGSDPQQQDKTQQIPEMDLLNDFRAST